MDIKGKKIYFLGDSITEGCGVTPDTVFHAVVAKETGCIPVNYGVGGSCLAREADKEEAKNWPPCFCDRIDSMGDDPDMIVVFGGTNDYGHGTAPIGTPDDRTPDTFYGACHYIIISLLEKYPLKSIVFMTPTHYQAELLPGITSGRPFIDYVRIIREVCGYYGIPVCDLYKNSGIAPILESQREIYIPDGVHPNALGHRVIASRFIGFVKTL